jgi:hypothetical protein
MLVPMLFGFFINVAAVLTGLFIWERWFKRR